MPELMSQSRDNTVPNGVLALPEILDLQSSQSLRESLGQLFDCGKIQIDAAPVARLSTPCVQVLLAAGRAADNAAIPFKIVGSSDAFRAAIADLGLGAHFQKWMA
jgi:anti-anti-sigma regulatory factor